MTSEQLTYQTKAKPKATADGIPVFCSHDKIVATTDLKPNPDNPNHHPDEQIRLLSEIIRSNGWRAPITVSTRSGLIVKGHGRYTAAKLAELKEVPVDYQEYANEAEEYADLMADNRISELSEMNERELAEIFAKVDLSEIPTELTGYTDEEEEELAKILSSAIDEEERNGWFDDHETGEASEEDSDEYKEFTEKFEQKRTTDDCYTPAPVYEAVADYVAEKYGVSRDDFVRPFHPGGDYQHEKYRGGVRRGRQSAVFHIWRDCELLQGAWHQIFSVLSMSGRVQLCREMYDD